MIPITELGEARCPCELGDLSRSTGGKPLFGIDLAAADDGVPERYARYGRLSTCVRSGACSSETPAALLAYARAMAYWHSPPPVLRYLRQHDRQRGGGDTSVAAPTPAVRTSTFHAMDPAVIVLVTRRDRCLLARQAGWPDRLVLGRRGFCGARREHRGGRAARAVRRDRCARRRNHLSVVTALALSQLLDAGVQSRRAQRDHNAARRRAGGCALVYTSADRAGGRPRVRCVFRPRHPSPIGSSRTGSTRDGARRLSDII